MKFSLVLITEKLLGLEVALYVVKQNISVHNWDQESFT